MIVLQGFKEIEKSLNGHFNNNNMDEDYCWVLHRKNSEFSHKRKLEKYQQIKGTI